MNINKNVAVSDNGFLFNSATGESFTLNEVGTELLNLIKDNKDLDEIKSILLKKYEVDSNIIEKDYQDFIEELKKYNLSEDSN